MAEKEKNRVRFAEIDLAKGVGILLVILGHIQYIHPGFRNFIVSFHIPLFFIVAGMLIRIKNDEKKPLSQNVTRKFFSILVPYLVFSVIFLIAQTIAWKLGGTISLDLIKENIYLTVILYGMSVLWFLGALFVGELVFFLLFKLMPRKAVPFVILALFVLCCVLIRMFSTYGALHAADPGITLLTYFVHDILRIGITLFFIAAGFYSGKFLNKLHDKTWIALLLGLAGLAVTIYISIINGGVDLHFLIFNNEILYFTGAVSGSLGLICLCTALLPLAHLFPFKVLAFYGRNSLIVMLTHVDTYLMYLSTIFVMHFFPDDTVYEGNVLFCILLFLLVSFAEGVIVLFINRFMPYLTGRPTRRK